MTEPSGADGSFTFTFDGVPVRGVPGQAIGAALLVAGIRSVRRTPGGSERGMFCGMGVCFDCIVLVDRSTVRSCVTSASPGLVVSRLDGGAHADR
ncbi:MAG: (2Fe-2S)-binding protein [Mycobacteriales bacterium]